MGSFMQTKLARYCDGLIEAAWIAALILVPLFFNIYSSRIFEPDKIAILRSLALIITAAWIVKIVDQGGLGWEKLGDGKSRIRSIFEIPIVPTVLAIAIVYLVATLFSVTPRVSLLGSYQRLQGTYTTLSYLVIFAAMLGNIRKRDQIERIVTAVILISLPITLYGILQRFESDPIPWGGDTSIRIAANMGNSIFVAAYLIMTFPLSVYRVVESFKAILTEDQYIYAHVIRSTFYIFIAALQVIAIYMSGSRGPALGWMASSFFLVLLLSLYWNKRWLTLLTIFSAGLIAVFLIIFNIERGPLDNLRNAPGIGRFGNLLNADSNSALVRKYIWQGAADLVTPHEPIKYPDGSKDRFNFLRPIIGYGPESMYVAYNPFYVPELALVERRNASPDRSHNETWDSLVITGVFGIFVYLAIFIAIFYYGLKWIGLITDLKQRRWFFLITFSGGAISALVFSLWRGLEYFGVAIPFGILLGLLAYITLAALIYKYSVPDTMGESLRRLTLIVLLAAIIAHFVEINFGIAIAATRTYFWVYTALLVLVGYILPIYEQYNNIDNYFPQSGQKMPSPNLGKRKKHGELIINNASSLEFTGMRRILIPGFLSGLTLVTLGYNFISNTRSLQSAFDIIWNSFTKLPQHNYAVQVGILALIIFTWLIFALVFISEDQYIVSTKKWLQTVLIVLSVSGIIGLIFWFWHANSLAIMARTTPTDIDGLMAQVDRYKGLFSSYFVYVCLILFIMGFFLPSNWPKNSRYYTVKGLVTGCVVFILAAGLASYTNIRVIQADIVYKLADPFTRNGQWPVAITIYDHANELATNEDYYYLFLGRAYLEHAKTLANEEERNQLISQAEADLKQAQRINPLNTDHTANLARLYSLWSSYVQESADMLEKGRISDKYFTSAVSLSPQNVRIWDEWALLYMNVLPDVDAALERLMTALEIDPAYHWTYGLLGEYYSRLAQNADADDVTKDLAIAADYFSQALDKRAPGEPQARYGYALALGGVASQIGDFERAIDAYNVAVELSPNGNDIWRVEEAIATLYIQLEDYESALPHAYNSASKAPPEEGERLGNLVAQLQQLLEE